ncbi:DUF1802 family protein [Paenibacillus filicis]|uniref:DUF1802 family protein n=1 Tax=Paenibacillus gyeongsangnamensis TaxID=3388067 RepID=A0ABT4Q9C1_9BACL|nr:DUF1802 family protein [Paenibacillus filicis]MCZ8513473.1 DUF1802 family protein [Paenibacillus filicis]
MMTVHNDQGQVPALKEWASAVEALRLGKQILIMRKGGIREETKDFQVESDSFYLYPTYEHQRKELVKPEFADQVEASVAAWRADAEEVSVSVYAELTEDILLSSQEELDKLRELHMWTDRFAEERLKWKKTKPLHVMLLRVYELETPVSLPILAEYNGCKSWIGLPADKLDGIPRKPVLSDEAFGAAANKVKAALV